MTVIASESVKTLKEAIAAGAHMDIWVMVLIA